MRSTFFIILAVFIVISGIWFITRTPLQDRDWLPEQSRLTFIEEAGNYMAIHNVRDWTYSDTEVLSKEWSEVFVSQKTGEIVRTWLYIDYFSSIHGIAHPFLSFEFSDGSTLVVSVEARRETHEAYSPIKGAFRAYELSYIWSTERDMLVRRLVNAKHSLSLYPLQISPEDSAALFHLLIKETNGLAEEPRFYNTITGNCMNLLARLINTLEPGRLPYDIAWNLPGYADRYLIEEGFIEPSAASIADINHLRDAVQALATSSPEVFSKEVRRLYASPK